MALEKYVKFLRGTPKAFSNLKNKDKDTLYFIAEPDSSTVVLYLGDKRITSYSSESFDLKDLGDVLLSENIQPQSVLGWDGEKWTDIPLAQGSGGVVGSQYIIVEESGLNKKIKMSDEVMTTDVVYYFNCGDASDVI